MAKTNVDMSNNDDKLFNLKKWRGVAGLTQKDVADRISCKTACYSKKENGKIEFRRSEMLLILEIINERLAEIGKEKVTMMEVFR